MNTNYTYDDLDLIRIEQQSSLQAYADKLKRIPKLNTTEELEYGAQVREGDKTALAKLVYHNLPFALVMAERFRGRGLPMTQLIQICNHALCRAAQQYGARERVPFQTFSVWWMRQACLDAIVDWLTAWVKERLKESEIKPLSNEKELLEQVADGSESAAVTLFTGYLFLVDEVMKRFGILRGADQAAIKNIGKNGLFTAVKNYHEKEFFWLEKETRFIAFSMMNIYNSILQVIPMNKRKNQL